METDFEIKLEEHGISHHCHTGGLYCLGRSDDTSRSIKVQFISSEPVDDSAWGSRNGNSLQAIGLFKFKFPTEVNQPDFYIFGFPNSNSHCIEYAIIPTMDIRIRLAKESQIATSDKEIEILFWLIPDNKLYETKGKGIEWEWFYISKGLNGRLADGTHWDYSEYLNDWNRLKKFKQ